MQVHHIDENPGNNDLENLIPLCAACHLKIEKEARLHAPYNETQLELFENQSYMQQMKNMRQSALEKYGLESKQKKAQIDKETYEIKELEWEINETPGLFCRERLLPNLVAPAFRFAVRNFVLLILLSDFFEVERNLLEDTLLPPAVFAAE